MFRLLPYVAGNEIYSIEMDQLWSPVCMVRKSGILKRKKYLLLKEIILVFRRIILQLKFTIFCDRMLIVHNIGTELLLEPAVTVQDKKTYSFLESMMRCHFPLTYWFNLTGYTLSHPKRQYQCRHHCENIKSYTDLRNSNQVRTYFIL